MKKNKRVNAFLGIEIQTPAYSPKINIVEFLIHLIRQKTSILVAKQENRLYFVNLYVHLQIGKRK